MQMLPEHQLPVPLQTKRYSLTHSMSWQVLRELHWAGYTCSFPADPRGLWQAAAPPLHEPWHEECHRAQSFHHFYLISMQNLQGIWWSIWAAMPAIRLMIRSFMYLSPLIQMALSQISECWKQGQHGWQRLKAEIVVRLAGSGKHYNLRANMVCDSRIDTNVGNLIDNHQKGLPLPLPLQSA